MIEIKNRYSGKVIYKVYKHGSRLDLRVTDLSYSCLSGADLSYSCLRGADLRGADLRGSDLRGSDLSGADLSGADLRGANLSDADLLGADLVGTNFIFLMLPYYKVYIHSETIRIGCKHYTKQQWSEFTDDEISKMSDNALEFWTKYKQLIMCAARDTDAPQQANKKREKLK